MPLLSAHGTAWAALALEGTFENTRAWNWVGKVVNIQMIVM